MLHYKLSKSVITFFVGACLGLITFWPLVWPWNWPYGSQDLEMNFSEHFPHTCTCTCILFSPHKKIQDFWLAFKRTLKVAYSYATCARYTVCTNHDFASIIRLACFSYVCNVGFGRLGPYEILLILSCAVADLCIRALHTVFSLHIVQIIFCVVELSIQRLLTRWLLSHVSTLSWSCVLKKAK